MQAFARTEMIAKVVDRMVKVVPPGPTEEAALKLIVHLYQVLTAATRGCIAAKGVKQVSPAGRKLLVTRSTVLLHADKEARPRPRALHFDSLFDSFSLVRR